MKSLARKKTKLFKATEEIQDIKYCPNGQRLAVGSRDNNVYIYTITDTNAHNDYHLAGVCKGHSRYGVGIDFLRFLRIEI